MTNPVFLKDIWPTPQEIEQTMRQSVKSEMFKKEYNNVFEGERIGRICRFLMACNTFGIQIQLISKQLRILKIFRKSQNRYKIFIMHMYLPC